MIRLGRRYDVFDASGKCAGNLTWRKAQEYAHGRRALLAARGRPSMVVIRDAERR